MPNERLRTAMSERGLTPAGLAEALNVDPKSIERWISGRTPYRRHRYAVSTHLGVDEVYLWPDALSPDQVASDSESEITNIYSHRWTVPSDPWRHMFETAEEDIGVLAYSGLFLSADAGIQRIFRLTAEAGVPAEFTESLCLPSGLNRARRIFWLECGLPERDRPGRPRRRPELVGRHRS